jgi:tetratricopeptide (TPR) repeat protein
MGANCWWLVSPIGATFSSRGRLKVNERWILDISKERLGDTILHSTSEGKGESIVNTEVSFDIQGAHEHFAKSTNGATWALLEKEDRSREDDFEMILAAHASLFHWAQIGTAPQLQRGQWLIAHVYTILGLGEAALRHASHCLEITENNLEKMQDFDKAYAFEGMARALALGGQKDEAKAYYQKAQSAGQQISDEEDRAIFMSDFKAGEWFGVI